MLQDLFKFSMLLFVVTGASYGAHIFIYSYLYPEGSPELINFAYKFNIGFSFLLTSSIILAADKLKEQLGFIYLAGGFVKLGVFYYLIKTSDYTINKSVFLHFFAPYVVCVVVEIFYVIKILNRANFGKDS